MDSGFALWTVAALALHVVLRHPFEALPLHMDTGFYVSNHTIRNRRFRFREGWNARYAGACKLVPEAAYSFLYLATGAEGYVRWSRRLAGAIAFGAAVAVGTAAVLAFGGGPTTYGIAIVLYVTTIAVPHWGGFFESAEQFQVLTHAVGFALVLFAWQQGHAPLAAAGATIWVADAFFVKLSNLLPTAILVPALALAWPATIPWLALGGVLAAGAYVAWAAPMGNGLRSLLGPLIRHEIYSGHRASPRRYASQARGKAKFLWRLASSSAPVLALAAVGAISSGASAWVLLTLLALAFAFVFQAAYVWYYALPLLMPLTLLATAGALTALDAGMGPAVLVLAALATWACWLAWRAWLPYLRGDARALDAWVWRPYGPALPRRNRDLEAAIPRLREIVGNRSVFLVGSLNQVYARLGTSWDTPLISAATWLDSMVPGWEADLSARLAGQQGPDVLLLDASEPARERLDKTLRTWTEVDATGPLIVLAAPSRADRN